MSFSGDFVWIVSTRYYSVPLSMFNIESNNSTNDSDEDEDDKFDTPVLHKKQRMILFTSSPHCALKVVI
jgi:hypothetical protein